MIMDRVEGEGERPEHTSQFPWLHDLLISSWASGLTRCPFTLCLQLVKHLEHARDHDLNPAVLRT